MSNPIMVFANALSQATGDARYVRGGSQVLNLRDYGAAGNGVHNDTANVQAWIDAGVAAGGALLYAPKGTYKLTAPILVKMNAPSVGLHIFGAGRGVTVFSQAAGIDGFVVGENGQEHADQMHLHDFTITGGRYLLRVNNCLLGTFERLWLSNGVVGLYIEGQTESCEFRSIQIISCSQNGILTGQVNGGAGLVLDLPEMQKCIFEAIRVYNSGSVGGAAVAIKAGILGAQQTSQHNTFRHILLESNNAAHQMTLDACSDTVIEALSVECDTLDVANTYSNLRIGASLQCSTVIVRNALLVGRADDNTAFKYGIEQYNGIVAIEDSLLGAMGAPGTADIFINDGGYISNTIITNIGNLVMTSPAKCSITGLRNSAGVLI